MKALQLRVRTPAGLVVDQPVAAVTAEDRDGWFGVRPGREALIALLPPGLLVFRDDAGECFVALSGGLLDLRGEECRVITREAVASRALEEVAEIAAAHVRGRARGAERRRGVMADLAREALRRLAQGRRS